MTQDEERAASSQKTAFQIPAHATVTNTSYLAFYHLVLRSPTMIIPARQGGYQQGEEKGEEDGFVTTPK